MTATEKPSVKRKTSKPKSNLGIVLAFTLGSMGGYGSAIYFPPHPITPNPTPSHIQIRFSPGGDCIKFTEQAIAMAQEYILVQAYAFTSPAIAQALIDAHKRGVMVKVLVDRSQLTAKYSQVKKIFDNHIPIAIDVVPGIAHNKVMIIDDIYVLTGSFNWTNAAEYRNAENLLLINDKDINKVYRENWEKRAARAQPIKLISQTPQSR
jgi:phospholipase D